jgi:clan AA aspartic protease
MILGTFSIEFEVGDASGQSWERLQALVDTGASYTWIPRQVLAKLGVQPEDQWEFEIANGEVIVRDVAQTFVRYDGRTHITFVAFGDDESTPLLGAYTLEGFRLAGDPVNRRLVPVRGLAL